MPRGGLGMPLAAPATQAAVLLIDDPLFQNNGTTTDIFPNYTSTRSNVLLYSQDTTQSQWVKTSTGIENALHPDPVGGRTANAITGAQSNSTKFMHQVAVIVAGETYTYSAHLKKENLGFARLEVSDGTTTYSGDFNLASISSTNTTRVIDTKIRNMDEGWHRVSITFIALNSSEGGQVRVYAMAANNTPVVNIADPTAILMFVWGQQLEKDIEATGYLPTSTSVNTVTTSLSTSHRSWDYSQSDIMPKATPGTESAWELPAEGELTTNGSFTTDSNWTKSNTTISNGVLNFASSGSAKYAYQDSVVEPGVSYIIKLTVVRTSGTLKLLFGTSGSGVSGISDITDSGSYTFTTPPLTSTEAGSGRFWAGYTSSGDNFIGTIDNVSVKEYAITPKSV